MACAALAWRLAYLNRLAATPLLTTLRGDEQSYWDWARFLASHDLVGANPFFQGPLYPYALALLQGMVGDDVKAALVVQMIWGSIAIGLITDVIRRLSGSTPALLVGGLLSANTMWVFFDSRILSESLLLFLSSALVWLWCISSTRIQGMGSRMLAPAIIGLMAQARATHSLLLIPHLLHLGSRKHDPLRAKSIGLSLLVFGLTMVPSALWNLERAGAFVPFSYNGGLNLYVGNNPRATGTFVWLDDSRRFGTASAEAPDGSVELDGREFLRKTRGLSLGPAESDAYWREQAIAYIAENPARTAGLWCRKLLLMFSREEIPQIEHMSSYARLAGPIGFPWFGGFLPIGVLGLVGLCLATASNAFIHSIRLQVGVLVLSVVPFFVTDRYRVHLLPPLAVLGAIGLTLAWDALRRPSPAQTSRVGIAFAGAVGLVCLPLGAVYQAHERWLAESDLGVRWLEAGRASEALVVLQNAARMEPQLLAATNSPDVLSADRAALHFNLGVALRTVGREPEALAELRQAAALNPQNSQYIRTLGDAYRARGRASEADSLLGSLPTLVAGDSEALLSEGFRAAREGRMDDAERAFDGAVRLDSRLYGAWGGLIRTQVMRHDVHGAERTLARARSAGLQPPVTFVYEALIAAERGDSTTAVRALTRIEESHLDPILRSVVRWTRERVGLDPGHGTKAP